MECQATIITRPGPQGRREDTDAILMCSEHGEVGRVNGLNYDVPRHPWDSPHPITMRVFADKWEEHLAKHAPTEATAPTSLPTHLL